MVGSSGPNGSFAEQMKRLLEGDAAAAAAIFDGLAPRLLRRLAQRYPYLDRATVEDLVQEAFLALWRRDGRLLKRALATAEPSERDLERLLFDQACGAASNRRRTLRRFRGVPLEEAGELASPFEVEAAAADRETLAALEACLRRASPRVFLYYRLRHRDGLDPEGISAVAGWSRKAVYKLKQSFDQAVRRCAKAIGLERH